MTDLTDAIAKVAGEHSKALEWFNLHAGETVSWSTIYENANRGARLVNQAKGIYKPHYTDYALSVRQTLNGTYADKEIIRRPDGSWVYPYFQENSNPAERDKEATNRGLMACMKDGIPIGVLLQIKPKPGVEYLVVGLAMVTEWKEGYFILEGFSDHGISNVKMGESDAAHDRARAASAPAYIEDFNAGDDSDRRDRQIAEVIRRRGQSKFRSSLIAAYQGKCAITGCDAVEALEAAHISPYRGAQTDHLQNGLLLRADVHSLFDLGLLSVNPITMTVVLSPTLERSSYAMLAGKKLTVPKDPMFAPNSDALDKHLRWTGIATD